LDTPEWVTDAVFYEIFPDRFARSERVTRTGLNFEDWNSPPTRYGFKGGDLFGVAEHLDYLQDLGINAIYLTPVFASASNHRYHTYDYLSVDPLLGGDQALRELLDSAHRRGMHVILDGVFNHASRGFWQFHQTLENGAGSPYVDWFYFDPDHLSGSKHWGAYPSTQEEENIRRDGSLRAIGYQGWWNMPGLPKFNTQTPAVREFLFGVAEHWIKFGIDGWRLDVPGEIDDDSFWQEFRHRVRALNPDAYLVGELWHDARRWLQGDQFDASMNYLLSTACLGFFTGNHLDLHEALKAGGYQGYLQALDAEGFASRIDANLGLYSPEVNRVELNLLDSHDTPRFLTCARGDANSLKLAWMFVFSFPGAPCIFYGDEVGLAGRQDPDCRQPFPWEASRWNADLRGFVKELTAVRRSHAALRRGDHECLYSDRGMYAFRRWLDREVILIALNAAETAQSVEIDLSAERVSEPHLLFGKSEIQVTGGRIRLTLPARTGAIIME
jgi:cyclomaltodextrinase